MIALVLVEPGFMNKLPRDAERLKFAVPAGFTASETLVECMVVRLVPGNGVLVAVVTVVVELPDPITEPGLKLPLRVARWR